VWAPAASAWVTLLRLSGGTTDGTVPVADGEPVPIMTSALTIAMARPMAEALGWPDKAIGWSDLAELAAEPKGWARSGHHRMIEVERAIDAEGAARLEKIKRDMNPDPEP
jgi:Ca-activated chloride channel family protein